MEQLLLQVQEVDKMRTYGINSNGEWIVLTETLITGSSNPKIYTYTNSTGNTFTITSTLYNANIAFTLGSITINIGDIILNDIVTNSNNQIITNIWSNITTKTTLPNAPPLKNISQQAGGNPSFFKNYGLMQDQEFIVSAGYIWLATLTQTLRLSINESPFYANYGIPAQTSVQTQIPPDLALNNTQRQYSLYFKSLTILRQQNIPTPTYNIKAVFLDGTTIQSVIAT